MPGGMRGASTQKAAEAAPAFRGSEEETGAGKPWRAASVQSQTPLAREAAPRRECGKASEGARSPPENAQPRPSSLRPRDTQKVVRTLHGGRGRAGHGLRGPGQELRRLQRCAARAESEKDGPLHRSEPKGYSRTSGRALPGELGARAPTTAVLFFSPPRVEAATQLCVFRWICETRRRAPADGSSMAKAMT